MCDVTEATFRSSGTYPQEIRSRGGKWKGRVLECMNLDGHSHFWRHYRLLGLI